MVWFPEGSLKGNGCPACIQSLEAEEQTDGPFDISFTVPGKFAGWVKRKITRMEIAYLQICILPGICYIPEGYSLYKLNSQVLVSK